MAEDTGPATGGPPRLSFPSPGRAALTLARPAQLNRLHREDLLALQAHCATLKQAAHVRVVLLQAEGRLFSAGFNLDELGSGGDAAAQDPRLFEATVAALEALPQPTVARLHGGVFGGATDLALACDFRIGSTAVHLRMPAARLGLHYEVAGLKRAVSRLGLGVAKRLFLLAETLDAATLVQLGWLDACVAPEALDTEVERVATLLEQGAPLALAGMKATLNELARGEVQRATGAQRVQRCAASADLQEGLAALREKRLPRFTGR
jgi:enoyl-CoA hydratase